MSNVLVQFMFSIEQIDSPAEIKQLDFGLLFLTAADSGDKYIETINCVT